jgi:hypothetical protein
MAAYMRRVLTSEYSVPPNVPFARLYDISMNPWTPTIFALAYVLLVCRLNKYQPSKNLLASVWAKRAILLHNLILAVYSSWTFVHMARPIFAYLANGFATARWPGLTHVRSFLCTGPTHIILEAYCDSSAFLWNRYVVKYGFLFYLSKCELSSELRL